MIIGLLKSIHQELKVWENTYGGYILMTSALRVATKSKW
jgi:hypothetical protein